MVFWEASKHNSLNGNTKRSVTYNSDSGILMVANYEVAKAFVHKNEFQVIWMDDLWAKWDLLQNSKELQGLIKTANERLIQSQAFRSKGAGKGL